MSSQQPQLTEGTVLRAEITGRKYTVTNVTDEQVRVLGLALPFSRDKIRDDIESGRLTIVDEVRNE